MYHHHLPKSDETRCRPLFSQLYTRQRRHVQSIYISYGKYMQSHRASRYSLPIMFPSIPPGGTKSRVETQVRLTVDLAHASASSGEPLKYDRVGSWKWLRLPKGTSTKRRTRKEGIIGRWIRLPRLSVSLTIPPSLIDASPEDTLHLTTEITCASPPHTKVTCCSSCQAREVRIRYRDPQRDLNAVIGKAH